MQNTPEIRTWIQDQLHARNWTRADLAKAAGTTQSMWSRIFSGETKRIQDSNVESLCRIFKINEDQLFSISHGKIFERAQQKKSIIHEPSAGYHTKWDDLAQWLPDQPEPVKTAIEAVALSHGWRS